MTTECTPSAKKEQVGRVRRDLFSLDNMFCINYSSDLPVSKIKPVVFVYNTLGLFFLLTHVNTSQVE